MWIRKELKNNARKSMRYNYWRCVIVCVILAFLVGTFETPMAILNRVESVVTFSEEGEQEIINGENLITNFASSANHFGFLSNTSAFQQVIDSIANEYNITGIKKPETEYKGFIGLFLNNINSSNSVIFGIVNVFNQIIFKGKVGAGIIIFVGILFSVAVWMFIKNIIRLGGYRFFMENRRYYSTDVRRMLFPYRVKRLWNQAKIIFQKTLFQVLWFLTIIGGFIKTYSYRMVPFIVAENPNVDSKIAFNLSKTMMKGQKWNAFIFDLSFLPWYIANMISFGISNILYTNPYKQSANTELYFALRRKAIEDKIEGYEALNDIMLDPDISQPNICISARLVNPFDKKPTTKIYYSAVENDKGKRDIFDRVPLGCVAIGVDSDYVDDYFPTPVYYSHFLQVDTIRNYSLLTYILFFFTFSMVGWIWEVTLQLFERGIFVNRGTMFGPWLPIYGTGGVIALLLLHRFVKKPVAVFIASFGISGVLEYATATFLWETKHMKWWDYTGNFMNIQGRICLEGLLIFAIGCMAALYFIGPTLDELFKKINIKIRIAVAAVLICLWSCDAVYSHFHPNMGVGINVMDESDQSQEEVQGEPQASEQKIITNRGSYIC